MASNSHLMQNFTLFNEEFRRVFIQVFNIAGVIVDLTGYDGNDFLWGVFSADDTLLTKTGVDITISDAVNGVISFDINETDLIAIPAGCYTQSLQMTDAVTGNIGIAMQGTVTIIENIF